MSKLWIRNIRTRLRAYSKRNKNIKKILVRNTYGYHIDVIMYFNIKIIHKKGYYTKQVVVAQNKVRRMIYGGLPGGGTFNILIYSV